LPLAGAGDGAAAGQPGPSGGATWAPARPQAGPLARPAPLQLLPLALAGAGADQARGRRLPPSWRPHPFATTGGAGARRPFLPLRRAALPGQGEAAGAARRLAAW